MNFRDLDDYLQKELTLLDNLAEAYFKKACAGDLKSAELLIEISQRRSKLLGLDAPSQSLMGVITFDSDEVSRQYETLSRNATGGDKTSLE
jgi:hypothetical protein